MADVNVHTANVRACSAVTVRAQRSRSKEQRNESHTACTNEDVLASVRRFFFPFFSFYKQTTERGGLTTRRIVVYPLREFERQEVLDGVEERR